MCMNMTNQTDDASVAFHLDEKARILAAVIAFVSAACSGVIILSFLAIKDLRKGTVRQLLVWLSLVDMGSNLANGVGATVLYDTALSCKIQGAFSVFLSLSQVFWTTSLAIYLYIAIVRESVERAKRMTRIFHVVNWTVPLALGIISFFTEAVGSTMSRTTVGWCWIAYRPKMPSHWDCVEARALWMFLSLKGWECLAYVVLPLLYILIKRHIDRQAVSSM